MQTERTLLTSRHAVRAVVVAGALVIGATVGRTSAAMEVVIWGRSLSPSELQAAHRALGAKWGISVP